MEDKKLNTMNNLFDELVLEAKLAFIKKFSYLGVTETTATWFIVNEIVRNAPETDGSILVHIKGDIVGPFSVIKPLLLDKTLAYFNYTINHVYNDGRVSLSLQRLYYDTKKKIIFGM
jgi:hypothetical protein